MSRTGLAAGYLRTSQFVTLHYLGDEPLRPPLGWLVLSLDGLARSIRLENGTGTGAGSGRLADPSRAIRLHQFSPGRSITVQLIFIRRAGQRLAYAPRVLTGIATTLDARRPTTDLTRLFRVERRITVDLPRGTGTFGKVLTRQAVRLHYLGESHLLPPFGRLVLALYDLPHGVELHNASEAGALPYRSIRLLHLSPGRAVDVELIFERESGSRIAYTSRVLANAP
jgi:hypothetical protein